MKRPLFSCVLPVKGARPYMDAAMESLRAEFQGVAADELEIIVQDADVEPDAGQSDALNKGFAKARGDWLFWLNADDVLLPGALGKVKALLRTLGNGKDLSPSWIVGNTKRIDRDGHVLRCVRGLQWYDGLFRHSVPHVTGPSAIFRREIFNRVGGFDVSLYVCMDWDLWIRFMQAGVRYYRIDSYLWGLRQWPCSKTQRKVPKDIAAVHRAEVRRMLEKNNFRITPVGNMHARLLKLIGGCYLLSVIDTLRERGHAV